MTSAVGRVLLQVGVVPPVACISGPMGRVSNKLTKASPDSFLTVLHACAGCAHSV